MEQVIELPLVATSSAVTVELSTDRAAEANPMSNDRLIVIH